MPCDKSNRPEISGSTLMLPASSAASARSNGPQREPTIVTSSMTTGAHGICWLPATVVFSTIVPRGRTSWSAVGSPVSEPVQSTTRSARLIPSGAGLEIAEQRRLDPERVQQRELLGMFADDDHAIGDTRQHLCAEIAQTAVAQHDDPIGAVHRQLGRYLKRSGQRFGKDRRVGRHRVGNHGAGCAAGPR